MAPSLYVNCSLLYINWFIQECTLIRVSKYTAIWYYSQCYSPILVCFRGIVTRAIPHISTNMYLFRERSEFVTDAYKYKCERGRGYIFHTRAIYLFLFVCGDIYLLHFTSLCIFLSTNLDPKLNLAFLWRQAIRAKRDFTNLKVI